MSVFLLPLAAAGAIGLGYLFANRRAVEPIAGSDPEAPEVPDSPPQGSDREGMGRMLASEAPWRRYTEAERVAIGLCALNKARRAKRTIAQLMLPPHHQKGYWCSTFQSATEPDLQLADQILSGPYIDVTNGAISFFEPAVQDKLFRDGRDPRDAAAVRAKWTGPEDNLELSATIGRWEFYRRRA